MEGASQLRQKAEAGDSVAQNDLGLMYLFSQGVEKDYVEAYAWFNLSAENGYNMAAKRRDSLGRLMPPRQLTAAQKRTEELKKLIAEKLTDSK